MQIGFDAKRAFLNNTGLGNYSRETINILSNYYPENNYFLYTPKIIKNKRLDFIKERKNIEICEPEGIINSSIKSYWRTKNIISDLLMKKINIYHGLSHEIPLCIEETKIKSIVTIHDLIFLRYPELYSLIDRKIYYYKIKSACRRADKIIAISEQTKKDIIQFLNIDPQKIKVVYQSCNNIFQSDINIQEKKSILLKYNIDHQYLLYVGSIERRKNLLTLLKTIKKLKNQYLVVIGNGGSYKKKCLKYIQEEKLTHRVKILSELKIKEIAAFYQSAQIMIYPSKFEGFGLPIIEALFSKTPIITSKGGCFNEAGGPKTKYINPMSVNDIYKAILEIQNSLEIQKEMKEEGYNYVQKFTHKKVAKRLMEVYEELQ